MKRTAYITLVLAAVAASLPARAQKLATVSVTREYEADLRDIEKPAYDMAVPDSVRHFDMAYDYSVFENEYRGAYEFNPYLLDMRPQKDAYTGRKLYVRAGAGYSLRPTLDAVWSPTFKKDAFRMNVYARHDSYVGKYRPVVEGDPYSGYDLLSKAGTDGRYDWSKIALTYDLNYTGIHTRDSLVTKACNALNASVGVKSKNPDAFVSYAAALRYGHAGVPLKYGSGASASLSEDRVGMSGYVSHVFSPWVGAKLGLDVDLVSYSGLFSEYAGNFTLTPAYFFRNGAWDVSAGVKLSIPASATSTSGNYSSRPQAAAADVNASYTFSRLGMTLYATVGGGNKIESYTGILGRNHWFSPSYLIPGRGLLDYEVEAVDAMLGARGNISGRFSYELNAGYANYSNAPLDAALFTPGQTVPQVIAYAGYQMFRSALKMKLVTAPVEVKADFECRLTDIVKNGLAALEPARFAGALDLTYNWNRRIFAGIGMEASSSRRGNGITDLSSMALKSITIDGWMDLFIHASYSINRKLSVWVEGDNLLNQRIQRTAFVADNGISFRLGACLNF